MDSQGVDARRIREVEFRDKMRGYNQEDVDEFLEKVALGVEFLEGELAKAQAEVLSLRAQLSSSSEEAVAASPVAEADVIQRTLLVAQRAADQLRVEADQEAAEIRDEAQRQADRIMEEARSAAEQLRSETLDRLNADASRLADEIDALERRVSELSSIHSAAKSRIRGEVAALLAQIGGDDGGSETAEPAAPEESTETGQPLAEAVDEHLLVEPESDEADEPLGWMIADDSPAASNEDVEEEEEVPNFVFGNRSPSSSESIFLWEQRDS